MAVRIFTALILLLLHGPKHVAAASNAASAVIPALAAGPSSNNYSHFKPRALQLIPLPHSLHCPLDSAFTQQAAHMNLLCCGPLAATKCSSGAIPRTCSAECATVFLQFYTRCADTLNTMFDAVDGRRDGTASGLADFNGMCRAASSKAASITGATGWQKVAGHYCSKYILPRRTYMSAAEAQRACLPDNACKAISDSNCDGKGQWATCRTSTGSASRIGSCMYKKADRTSPPPPSKSRPATQQRGYGDATCGFMQGRYTCSSSAVRHSQVKSLDGCKLLCNNLGKTLCNFVMWSPRYSGYCYTSARCATSGQKNCNLQMFAAKDMEPAAPTPSPPDTGGVSSRHGSVVVLRDPRSMQLKDRGQLMRALKSMQPKPTVSDVLFVPGKLSTELTGAAAVLIYSQDNCYMALETSDKKALSSFVTSGGLLVVMGDFSDRVDADRIPHGYSCDLSAHVDLQHLDSRADAAAWLLSSTFHWKGLRQAKSFDVPFNGRGAKFTLQESAAHGTVFAGGPSSLSGSVTWYSALSSSFEHSIPGAKMLYQLTVNGRSRPWAGVWMAPRAAGHVVYLGWDWRSFGWSHGKGGADWTAVLQRAFKLVSIAPDDGH